MKQKSWKNEVRDFLSTILQSRKTRATLIHDLSSKILNYFNHKADIAYGLTLDLFADDNAPFVTSTRVALTDQTKELVRYLEEESGICLSDYQDIVIAGFSKWLTDNWPEIIKARLRVEKRFSHTQDFVTLRRFLVAAEEAGVQFYTKDWDGSGPDIIGGTVTTNVVHSDYESVRSIKDHFKFKELTAAIKPSEDDSEVYGFGFANINIDFTAQEGKEGVKFFGPVYAHPFYQRPKKDKDAFANALAGAITELALPATLDLKFKPGSDRIVFDIFWERKLPERFYNISNHNSRNRFEN